MSSEELVPFPICSIIQRVKIVIKEIFIMYKKYFGFSVIIASLSLIFMIGCKSNSSSPTEPSTSTPSTNTISMAGNTFSPSSLTVAAHTTITWNNNSAIAHTSTSDNGKWDTGNISAGSSSQTVFDSVGTYHYHCRYHSGMVGVITVQ
jgi:plastocyanin